jgi:glycine/D-amino acid oxidase-like deaminating enzyme
MTTTTKKDAAITAPNIRYYTRKNTPLRFATLALVSSSSFLCRGVASLSTMSMGMKNIVVVGGGVQGTSVAYQLAKKATSTTPLKITILESKEPASAASGKGGGFMARSWGDGSPTQGLHHLAFDMYEGLSKELGCESYRKLPVLSVSPEGGRGISKSQKQSPVVPSWLDGKSIGRVSPMGYGDDTAQITPKEFVEKMLGATTDSVSVVLGTCTGVVVDDGDENDDDAKKITGVRYCPRGSDDDDDEEEILEADAVVVSAGPWSCQAEDWFPGSGIQLPMEGVKSTSIVWKQPEGEETVDATALFCGEDYRFNTHRKSFVLFVAVVVCFSCCCLCCENETKQIVRFPSEFCCK